MRHGVRGEEGKGPRHFKLPCEWRRRLCGSGLESAKLGTLRWKTRRQYDMNPWRIYEDFGVPKSSLYTLFRSSTRFHLFYGWSKMKRESAEGQVGCEWFQIGWGRNATSLRLCDEANTMAPFKFSLPVLPLVLPLRFGSGSPFLRAFSARSAIDMQSLETNRGRQQSPTTILWLPRT